MPNIHDKLYEAAILDCESVKVLNKNNLFPTAIYHCAQTVEKSSKSIHAYYMIIFQNKTDSEIGKLLKGQYGHNLKQSTKGIIETLMKLYIKNEIKNNPKITRASKKQASKDLNKTAAVVEQQILDMDEIIIGFDALVEKMYENVYQRVNSIINGFFDSLDSTSVAINKELTDPNKQYLRYIFLLLILSSFLNQMEMYSRYPMNEISNNNITLLKSNRNNKQAIERITIMIGELINLVPTVWKELDFFKTSLPKHTVNKL